MISGKTRAAGGAELRGKRGCLGGGGGPPRPGPPPTSGTPVPSATSNTVKPGASSEPAASRRPQGLQASAVTRPQLRARRNAIQAPSPLPATLPAHPTHPACKQRSTCVEVCQQVHAPAQTRQGGGISAHARHLREAGVPKGARPMLHRHTPRRTATARQAPWCGRHASAATCRRRAMHTLPACSVAHGAQIGAGKQDGWHSATAWWPTGEGRQAPWLHAWQPRESDSAPGVGTGGTAGCRPPAAAAGPPGCAPALAPRRPHQTHARDLRKDLAL